MKRNRSVAGATITILVGLSSCGSGGSNTNATASSTTPAPTSAVPIAKAQFLVRAKLICHNTNLQIAQVPRGGDPASQSAGEKAIVGLVQVEIAQFKALGYPQGDRNTLEPIYDGALAAVTSGGPGALAPWGVKLKAYGLDCGSQ